MTAIIHTTAVPVTHEADVLSRTSSATGIEDFLRDPIGYGDYDFADPISLDQYASCRHMRGTYVASLG